MKSDNIFSSLPENSENEFIDSLLKNENVHIERIISKGHTSPSSGWYDQDKDEWVLLLKGNAIIAFEGNVDKHLGLGDYINIPAHTKHKVMWTDPEVETVWLAVHY